MGRISGGCVEPLWICVEISRTVGGISIERLNGRGKLGFAFFIMVGKACGKE